MDKQAAQWKSLLLDALESYPVDAPLAMSGGMDSSAILAGLLELGREPLLYHFKLKGYESKDYLATKKIAEVFGLTPRFMEITPDFQTLTRDVQTILKIIKCTYKTAIQCAHPFLYVSLDLNTPYLVVGNPGIVEESRRAQFLYNLGKLEELQRFREEMAEAPGNGYYGTLAEAALFEHFGISVLEPYRNPSLVKYSLSLSVSEINTPKQKGIALRAFPEFFNQTMSWKRNADSQIESGFSHWHKDLLTGWDTKNIVAVYNKMLRDLFPVVIAVGGGAMATEDSPVLKMRQSAKTWPRLGKKGSVI